MLRWSDWDFFVWTRERSKRDSSTAWRGSFAGANEEEKGRATSLGMTVFLFGTQLQICACRYSPRLQKRRAKEKTHPHKSSVRHPRIDRREIPPLRRPAASQERSRTAKAPACFGRNDRFFCLLHNFKFVLVDLQFNFKDERQVSLLGDGGVLVA